MRIDGNIPYSWDKINEALRKALGTEKDLRVFKGTSHALFEICLGLHLRFSHKRKMVAHTGFGSHLKTTQIELAKLGVRFKDSFDDDMKKEAKSSLAFVSDWDDALTGELYDRQDALNHIAETNMFRIHILHHLFYYQREVLDSIGDYDIFVCSLAKDLAMVILGDKCSLPNLSANELFWGEKHIQDGIKLIQTEREENYDRVSIFESQLPQGCARWFGEGQDSRIFDRAVVKFPNIDGWAFVELFSQDHGMKLGSPGDFNPLETTSYCRWNNKNWIEQAESFNRTPDDIRGLVTFSKDTIDDQLPDKIVKIINKIGDLSH